MKKIQTHMPVRGMTVCLGETGSYVAREDYNSLYLQNAKLLEALKKINECINSITCHCAEGPEFFSRAVLMECIEKDAVKAFGIYDKLIKEGE